MINIVERFWDDENGSSTVDWLVLTAGVVLLGAAVMAAVVPGTQNMADSTADVVEEAGFEAI